MSETTKELADRLEAEDRLRKRGYEKKTCPVCKGVGEFTGCGACQNKGYGVDDAEICRISMN